MRGAHPGGLQARESQKADRTHLNLIKALLVPERNGHELGIGMLSSVFRGSDVVLAQPEVGFPVKDFPVGRPLLWLLGEHFTQLCHAIF